MKRILNNLFVVFFLTSCTPLVTSNVEQTYSYPPDDESVRIFGLNTEIPADAEVLGIVKVGDSGFTATKNCTFHEVLNNAKAEAKRVGGNAIKITDHIPPGKSTCHRITAKILRLAEIRKATYQEVAMSGARYAILNIFCEQDTINAGYDLHMGDSVICRITNNLRSTIAIREEGFSTIWAELDKKAEIQINLEFGNTYYLKCGLLAGDTGNRPSLELVDSDTGSRVFNHFRTAK